VPDLSSSRTIRPIAEPGEENGNLGQTLVGRLSSVKRFPCSAHPAPPRAILPVDFPGEKD